MSVEKMEQYKEYKKHRKEILRKQKRQERLYAILGITSCVLILGLVGFFVYQDIKPDYVSKTTSLIDWNQYIPDDILDGEDDTEGTESEEAADGTSDAASDNATDNNADGTSETDTTGGQE